MFAALVRNTAFSAAAFILVGLLNLAIIPVLMQAYGLQAFGLIVLARVFLPTGFMAMFDLGISESATHFVARAKAGNTWSAGTGQVSFLFVGAVCIGVLGAAVFVVLGQPITLLFNVDPILRDSFVQLVQVTGITLILLYPGLLLEGIVKGFERYRLLRSMEVLSTLAYVLTALWLVRHDYPYDSIAYTLLLVTVLKYVVLALILMRSTDRLQFRLTRWTVDARREVWRRSVLMFHSKILGAVQGQAPPLLIAAMIGPAGVAVYDVLVKLPRFAKMLVGFLNAALLPFSARLHQNDDKQNLQRLGHAGFVLAPAVWFSLLTGAAVFAEELLRLWLGPLLTHYWPWLTLMFLVPMLGMLLGFGQTILQVRYEFIAITNRLLFVQLIVQIALSIAFSGLLQERAFILGQVVAGVLFFPWHMLLVLRAIDMSIDEIVNPLLRQLAVILILLTMALGAKAYGVVDGPISLLVALVIWCTLYWGIAYLTVLSPNDRTEIKKALFTVFAR